LIELSLHIVERHDPHDLGAIDRDHDKIKHCAQNVVADLLSLDRRDEDLLAGRSLSASRGGECKTDDENVGDSHGAPFD